MHLHAVLEGGEPALVVDDRLPPYFYVRAADRDALRQAAPAARVADTPLATFLDEPVLRVEVDLPGDVPPLRARLAAAGVESFEADVRFAYRYLIDHRIRGAFAVDGPFERRPGVGRVYRNPRIEPADFVPRLRVLSFDVETSLDGRSLYSIAAPAMAASGSGWSVRASKGRFAGLHEGATGTLVPSERACVEGFLGHLRTVDPDVLTGWNVGDFDVPVLQRVARRARLRLALGRTDEEAEVRRDLGFTRDPRVILSGRQVLDGLALLRSAFVKLDDYRLDTAAQAILGKGKLFAAEHRGQEIEAAWRDDPARLAAYNLNDARLVLEILDRTGLVELTVRRSLLTGMQLDRVGAQIAAVDSLYLAELRERRRVAPSVHVDDAQGTVIAGGLVLDSVPGLYRNILVFDFKSLYPSLIRTFNIDPLTHVLPARETPDLPLVRTPSGATFRADEPGILPELVARLWEERAKARKEGDAVGAQATKILMNSLFGVLGASACRLFSPPSPTRSPWPASTSSGWPRPRSSKPAIASSTATRTRSSSTRASPIRPGRPSGPTACARRSAPTSPTRSGPSSPSGAGSSSSSRRSTPASGCRRSAEARPAARSATPGWSRAQAGETLELVGLEAVRRDWSAVARRFQRELLQLVFHDQPVDEFIRYVRGRPAGRPVRRPAGLPEGDPEAARVLHADHAAARQGGAEAGRRARAHRRVRRHHGGPGGRR